MRVKRMAGAVLDAGADENEMLRVAEAILEIPMVDLTGELLVFSFISSDKTADGGRWG